MYKEWVKFYGILLIVSLLFIGSLNFFMDPFWTFSHSHKYNNIQKGTNERQQKANYIYFTNNEFDTLLLGSSRTTYMNRHSFEPLNVFNFSAAGMRPKEYLTYIDFVIEDCKQPIDTIIIGMDFFGYLDYGLFMFDNASSIVNTTQATGYRWKILFGFDTLNNYFKERTDDRYNRDVVKIRNYISNSKEQVKEDVRIYANTEYSGNNNKDWQKNMYNIVNKHQTIDFLIYTTPVSEPLLKKLIEMHQYKNYENWLKSLVDIFGVIHHFMYSNVVTKEYLSYFADSNHAYTNTNHLLARQIMQNYDVQKGFGMILTKENIEEKLKELRKLNGINP
jgi:hypothetical protein